MTRQVLATCGAMAIAGLAVTAQSPQPSTAQPPSTYPAASARTAESDKLLTITGCVARAGSTSPTSSASAAGSGGFILTNAQPAPKAMSSPDSPAATTPPGASTGPRSTASSYTLKAQGVGVDLGAHLNHKVTVTGTLDSMAGSSSSPSATEARPAAAMPTLNVTSVTMVSSSCS
jgi:hypothetical protein